MRDILRRRVFGATLIVMALLLAACGDGAGDDAGSVEGPTITVASFNFPESVILAEIYAQALEANGYDVERNLNLGSRELIFYLSTSVRPSPSVLPLRRLPTRRKPFRHLLTSSPKTE
jgi:hypothetical protein